METDRPVSRTSQLYEARHRLRKHLAIETLLLELTDLLPKDGYDAEPRDCFQLGAGQAMLDAGDDAQFSPKLIDLSANPFEMLDPVILEQITQDFCATRPYNKYSHEHYYDPCELEAFVYAYHLVNQAVQQVAPDIAI